MMAGGQHSLLNLLITWWSLNRVFVISVPYSVFHMFIPGKLVGHHVTMIISMDGSEDVEKWVLT